MSEEVATFRARFAGFIEAVPDKEKVLREVYTNQNIKQCRKVEMYDLCVCQIFCHNLTRKLRLQLHVKVMSLAINHIFDGFGLFRKSNLQMTSCMSSATWSQTTRRSFATNHTCTFLTGESRSLSTSQVIS